MDKSILIVDDDLFLRDLYAEIFITANYKVTTATDGQEAVNAVEANTFSAILLDVTMPKKDGLEALKEIKASPNGKDVPVIMLTNFGQGDLIKTSFEQGATDYILKYSVTPGEVLERIEKLLTPKTS